MRFPKTIHVIYAINFIFQFRKWYVYPRIKSLLKKAGNEGLWIDLGCGEGQYLVPISKKFPSWKTIGVDNNPSNISFLKKVIPANAELILTDIEKLPPENKADLITCIGVLQYIEDDEKALQKIYGALLPGGNFLLYSPVNGQLHISLYKYLLTHYSHYESVNNRRRIYQQAELEKKLRNSGFKIESATITYGYWGRISHEIFNILLVVLTSSPWPLKLFAGILLIPATPLVILLMAADFCTTHKNGNGIMITAVK